MVQKSSELEVPVNQRIRLLFLGKKLSRKLLDMFPVYSQCGTCIYVLNGMQEVVGSSLTPPASISKPTFNANLGRPRFKCATHFQIVLVSL